LVSVLIHSSIIGLMIFINWVIFEDFRYRLSPIHAFEINKINYEEYKEMIINPLKSKNILGKCLTLGEYLSKTVSKSKPSAFIYNIF